MKIKHAILAIGLLSCVISGYTADKRDDAIDKKGTWFSVINDTGKENYAYTHVVQGHRKTYDNFRLRVTLSTGHTDSEWLNKHRDIPKVFLPGKVNRTSESVLIEDPDKLPGAAITDKVAAYVTCDYLNHHTKYSTPWVMGVATLEISPQDVRKIEVEFKGLEGEELQEVGVADTKENATKAPPKLGWIINGVRLKQESEFNPYPPSEPTPFHLSKLSPRSEPTVSPRAKVQDDVRKDD